MTWLKSLARFDEVLAQHHGIDVERLLGELSRLNGIMNIEAGVDADALQATLIERLAESGVDVDPEVLSALTEPLARIYAIPDHLHALAHMLGDGPRAFKRQGRLPCAHARSAGPAYGE